MARRKQSPESRQRVRGALQNELQIYQPMATGTTPADYASAQSSGMFSPGQLSSIESGMHSTAAQAAAINNARREQILRQLSNLGPDRGRPPGFVSPTDGGRLGTAGAAGIPEPPQNVLDNTRAGAFQPPVGRRVPTNRQRPPGYRTPPGKVGMQLPGVSGQAAGGVRPRTNVGFGGGYTPSGPPATPMAMTPQFEAGRRQLDDAYSMLLQQLGSQRELVPQQVGQQTARIGTDVGYADQSLLENVSGRGVASGGVYPYLYQRDIATPFGRQKQDLADWAAGRLSGIAGQEGQAGLNYNQGLMELLLNQSSQIANQMPLETPFSRGFGQFEAPTEASYQSRPTRPGRRTRPSKTPNKRRLAAKKAGNRRIYRKKTR